MRAMRARRKADLIDSPPRRVLYSTAARLVRPKQLAENSNHEAINDV